MRPILALSALILLVGCGPTPPDSGDYPLGEQERINQTIQRTTEKMQACFVVAAKDLDDGKSDANTIAHGVVSRCTSEVDEALTARASGMSMLAYNDYMIQGRQAAVAAALIFVLQERHRS